MTCKVYKLPIYLKVSQPFKTGSLDVGVYQTAVNVKCFTY